MTDMAEGWCPWLAPAAGMVLPDEALCSIGPTGIGLIGTNRSYCLSFLWEFAADAAN